MREGGSNGRELMQHLGGVCQRDSSPAFSILTILTADIQNFLDEIGEHHLLSRIQQTGNINSVNTNGFTLLMLVVRHKEFDLLKHLLKHLQKEHILFKSGGEDAVDMAISLLDDDLIDMFKDFGFVESI